LLDIPKEERKEERKRGVRGNSKNKGEIRSKNRASTD